MDGGDSLSEGTHVSDSLSDVTHVSDSLSDSTSLSGSLVSLSDNAADEISRNIPPYYDIMEFNDPIGPPPMVEEEDDELYPPEEEAFRRNNWSDASFWMGTPQVMERVAYNVDPYYLPILYLGKDSLGNHKASMWDGGWLEYCDTIGDIFKLRPREGCTRDQIRVEYVRGWVSHLRDARAPNCFAKFNLYDGSRLIRVRLWNDRNTHTSVTTGVLREGCVVVLYHVAVFINMNRPFGRHSHRLSSGYSNVLAIFPGPDC